MINSSTSRSDDSSEDETLITDVLSSDIMPPSWAPKPKSRPQSRHRAESAGEGEQITRRGNDQIYNGKVKEEKITSAFLLKNTYCIIIVNNDGFKTEDLALYYAEKIVELKSFLERIANFSTIKVFENRTGVHFLRIFENVTHDPSLEHYDSFLCFILFENEATSKHKTADSISIPGAISIITKSSRLTNEKPKLFFIQEITTNKKTSTKKGNHLNPLVMEDDWNEVLLVHERGTLSKQGLLIKLLEIFREYSDRENILAMLARCSYSAIYFQLHILSKPIVFANCYGKRTHVGQVLE